MQTHAPPRQLDGDYPDGVAVVIGASGGIGKGICLAIAQTPMLRNRPSMIKQLGYTTEAFALELSSPEQVSAAFTDIQTRHQRIHTLVFAAGADTTMTFVGDIDPVEWQQTIHRRA